MSNRLFCCFHIFYWTLTQVVNREQTKTSYPFCTFAAMNLSFTITDVNQAAEELWEYGKHFSVWAFHAPMGAGKTTFIHSLCTHVLQITDKVSSPTFAIINEYKSKLVGTVYHMDWYRLKGEEEALQTGAEDCLLSGHLCLVEWPEITPSLLPANALHIYITIVNETTRKLTTG